MRAIRKVTADCFLFGEEWGSSVTTLVGPTDKRRRSKLVSNVALAKSCVCLLIFYILANQLLQKQNLLNVKCMLFYSF